MEPRLPGEPGQRQAVLGGDHLVVFAYRLRQHGVGEFLLIKHVAPELLARPQKEIALGGALDMDAGCSRKHQRLQARAIAYRDLGSEPAAQRTADHRDASEIKLLQDIEIEKGKIVNLIEPLRGF